MFGFAWSELVLIGAVALVVIGPKDLPKVMRTMGQWSRRLRALTSDFQRHIDEMVRQAELDEIKRTAEKAMDPNSMSAAMEEAVGAKDIEKAMSLDEFTTAAEAPLAAPPPAEPPAAVTEYKPEAPAPQPEPTSAGEPGHSTKP